jgi:TRAP transporter 4TM/12TM fusion protein
LKKARNMNIKAENSSLIMKRSHLEMLLSLVTIGLVIFFAVSTRGDTFQRRSLFLMCVLIFCFLKYPLKNSLGRKFGNVIRKSLQVIDCLYIGLTILTFSYVFYFSKDIVMASGTGTKIEVILGYVAIFLVLEATRRSFGKPLVILSLAFIIYIFVGPYVPGIFHHPGFSARRVSIEVFLTLNGIFSIPMAVFLKYVFLFIFFGAILEIGGGADFFINFAKSLCGHVTGGPAKIAVISSGILGMLSGSVLANTLTTGAVTIPMMKRMGYDKNFAAGVETAASTGGQLVPPVMGAAIFVMVEFTGINYFSICKHAIFPALLFYLAIFSIVHFISLKNKLTGIPRAELPRIFDTMKRSFYFIPIVVLIIVLALGYSVQYSILWAIITLFTLTFLTKESRLISSSTTFGKSKIFDVIENTAKRACPISVAGACIGIVLGLIGLSGVSLKISSAILQLAGYHMILALIFTMILALIFGMGMDTITVYILLAVLLAPGIVNLGTIDLSAHLFIFYFGMMAMVTPPVCLAAYAAAGIADGDPIRSGFWGWRLALAGFLLPYMFIYNPAILLIGDLKTILLAVGTSIVGIIALAGAIAGFLRRSIGTIQRILLFSAALLLIKVGLISDIVGVSLALLATAGQFVKASPSKK